MKTTRASNMPFITKQFLVISIVSFVLTGGAIGEPTFSEKVTTAPRSPDRSAAVISPTTSENSQDELHLNGAAGRADRLARGHAAPFSVQIKGYARKTPDRAVRLKSQNAAEQEHNQSELEREAELERLGSVMEQNFRQNLETADIIRTQLDAHCNELYPDRNLTPSSGEGTASGPNRRNDMSESRRRCEAVQDPSFMIMIFFATMNEFHNQYERLEQGRLGDYRDRQRSFVADEWVPYARRQPAHFLNIWCRAEQHVDSAECQALGYSSAALVAVDRRVQTILWTSRTLRPYVFCTETEQICRDSHYQGRWWGDTLRYINEQPDRELICVELQRQGHPFCEWQGKHTFDSIYGIVE